MSKARHSVEIYLQPGEFHFGGRDLRIRTLLGSCVAITMWHPRLRIGGMCHFMLPSRPNPSGDPDGRYADEAIDLFHRAISISGTNHRDYEVKMFGGGSMFELGDREDNIASRNVQAARKLLQENGHHVVAEHVGMYGSRYVIFDIRSGTVWLRHAPVLQQEIGEWK
ncbi:MAG: chemotaxis protein CheD [Burkholderiales bacterium]|nr:chemotaxis protein CheD [Burkholderiales bacterium]